MEQSIPEVAFHTYKYYESDGENGFQHVPNYTPPNMPIGSRQIPPSARIPTHYVDTIHGDIHNLEACQFRQ